MRASFRKGVTTSHTIRPEAEAVIEHAIDLFYQQLRHHKTEELHHDTVRAIRMADLRLIEMHAMWNAGRGRYEDSTRGFKTIEHLKKVYRI